MSYQKNLQENTSESSAPNPELVIDQGRSCKEEEKGESSGKDEKSKLSKGGKMDIQSPTNQSFEHLIRPSINENKGENL
jgi:hypothetical protein